MASAVSIADPALAQCLNDLDKRLQIVERQLYLIMWLVGVVGSAVTALLIALLVRLVS